MNNVLIVGAGYVGTKLFSYANKNTANYFILSRKELDYGNQSALAKFLLNNNITHVINCSGFTGRPNVDEAELKKKECWDLNVVIPLKVSKVCKGLDINYIHISSGCIFSGYEKQFTEEDEPNFGLYDYSSFYSKSKHAFETLNNYGCTIRVRMPFCDDYHERNFITKILKYDNLINYRNSKTYISTLCRFIEHLIDKNTFVNDIGIINFVNPDAQDTKFLVDILKIYGVENKNWKIVDIEDIDIKAPRSNCILSMDKFTSLFPDFHIESEKDAIAMALTNMIFPES